MIAISLRLPDGLVHDLEKHARKLHLSKTSYIREAINKYNTALAAKERHDRLMQLSLKVRASSLRVNKEFSEIEHDPEN